MPIYLYECSDGHQEEFLKLSAKDKAPKKCHCGKVLKKTVSTFNWKYTRGKNVNWPLADPVDPTPQGPDEVY